MELTSAVRSVSYKSDMNKCNGNAGKSNDSENLNGGNKVILKIEIRNIGYCFYMAKCTKAC